MEPRRCAFGWQHHGGMIPEMVRQRKDGGIACRARLSAAHRNEGNPLAAMIYAYLPMCSLFYIGLYLEVIRGRGEVKIQIKIILVLVGERGANGAIGLYRFDDNFFLHHGSPVILETK